MRESEILMEEGIQNWDELRYDKEKKKRNRTTSNKGI